MLFVENLNYIVTSTNKLFHVNAYPHLFSRTNQNWVDYHHFISEQATLTTAVKINPRL